MVKRSKPGLFTGSGHQAPDTGKKLTATRHGPAAPPKRQAVLFKTPEIPKKPNGRLKEIGKRKTTLSRQPGSAHAGWRITPGF
jgi:hypothetical protein